MNTTLGIIEHWDVPPHETDVLDSIAEFLMLQSAEYAEQNEWHRHVMRDVPDWNDPMYWEQESKAKREAIAETIELLYHDYSNGNSVSVVSLLTEVHSRAERAKNVKQSVTGAYSQLYISGRYEAFVEAEKIIRDVSEFGWPSPDPIAPTDE